MAIAALSFALLIGVVACSSPKKADLSTAKKQYEAGKYAESEKTLTEVLKDDPNNIEALRTMALALAAQSKNAEALKQYAKIVKIDPKDDEAFYSMAVIERLIGKTPTAVKHLEAAAKVKPGPKYSDELARTYMQVGRYEDAIEQWQNVLKESDADPAIKAGIYSALATAYESARKYDEARAALEQALKLTPKDTNLQARLKALGK